MSDPSVLSSDGDLVAVSKPTGWVVHAAMTDERYDLRAWLTAQPKLPKGLEPLHRLDRDTSGVVLYAASSITRARVGRYFMDGTVQKSYLALVQGHAHKKGVIRVPLHPDDGGAPQDAVTRYRLEEALGAFSLLRVTPETGRKHQIRRHLHGLGLSVVGDERYTPRKKLRVPAYPGRMFLHAARIELPDGQVFEAPLPEELSKCLVALRSRPERPKVESDPDPF
ncbi:MAG: RluA family pseudouridine synthase [Pseudomonadota bacterium]|nr:RluA family pseudouridine synthase [Pseudomonadota bacterium]